ncbi:TPA: M48 family peptidase [Candidatus Pacearchaeota archaeon]|jgi:hypothetical protein|nr:M48 family peptidase [Candidatus Pacearchaeota archaeon]
MLEKRKIYVLGIEYDVFIHLERRNSTRASITRRGINLRLPGSLSRARRELEISKLIDWAVKKLREKPIRKEKERTYEHAGFLRTHSKIYQVDIKIRDSVKNFSKIDGNYLRFMIASKHNDASIQEYISKKTRKLLAKAHLSELKAHVNRLNDEHFNQKINKISYAYTKSRWGVCKFELKEIELSTRLLLAPLPILEYVIVHEIAHLIESNHSSRFWNIVRSVDSRYKDKINWLKENGHELVL